MKIHPINMDTLGTVVLGASVLGLGIPYATVIALYCILGWPNSQPEEGKYQRALHPTRVINLNYVMMQQVGMVRYLPLYLRFRRFYKEAETVTKDIPYGRNGNTLDVWRSSKTHLSDSQGISSRRLKPIFVFVYGGAWALGDKNMYGLLAQKLADKLGAIVCVPNYSIYPKGIVTDMLKDLEDTISWIKSSELIQNLGGDPKNIILCGHSAGGHLVAMVAVDLAQRAASQRSNSASSESSTSAKEASDLLSSVQGVIAISGVFHIMDHYHFEAWRGVEDVSCMWRVMEGRQNFDKYSPMLRLEAMDSQQIARLPSFVLIHGTEDGAVPLSASSKFASALSQFNIPVSLKIIPEGGHSPLVVDMMEEGRHFHDEMTALVKREVERILMNGSKLTVVDF